MMNDLSIISITYNSESFIRDCLNSIGKSTNIAPDKLIIDAGSNDSTIDIVEKEYHDWKFIRAEKNGGYGYAANIGIAQNKSSYVLVMNSDVIVEPATISRLLEFMRANTDVGICSCRLLNIDGTLQRSFRMFPCIKFIFLRLLDKIFNFKGRIYSYRYLMLDANPDEIQDVDWLLGSFLLIRREALDRVGLFDERFFLYCEDVDLCARMKRGGWRVTYAPVAQAVHKHRQMSFKNPLSGLWFYHMISMLRFLMKKTKP